MPNPQGALLAHFQIRPVLVDLVREAREHDQQCAQLKELVQNGLRRDLRIWRDGALMMGNRLFVPKNNEVVKKEILDEAHIFAYAMHLGSTNLYHIIRSFYYWYWMKQDVAEYVKRFIICQQVKKDRQRP